MKKLKKFDWSCFIGKSHFQEHGTKNYLVFQRISRYFKGVINSDYILSWISKGLSDENITLPSAPHSFLNPSLSNLGTKTRVRFSGSYLNQDTIKYNYWKIINIYIVYGIHKNDNTTSSDPALENWLFGAVSLTKNSDIGKYKYSGYGIGFDRKATLSFANGVCRNVIIIGVDISSSIKIDNRKKDILIFYKGPTPRLEYNVIN